MAEVLPRTAVLFYFLSEHKATLKNLIKWTRLDIAWGDFSDVGLQKQYYFSNLDLLTVLASSETSFLTKNKLRKACNDDYTADQKDAFLLPQKKTWH